LINPLLIAADESKRAPTGKFRAREFLRIVALTRPYRRALVVGLILTVAFAGLHAASIGGAFPVFQILLEDEGLHGWVNRTIAGHRLGVDFAPINAPDVAHVIKVHSHGPANGAGIRMLDQIADPQSRPIEGLLAELAEAPPGADVPVSVGTGEQRRTVVLRPTASDIQYRLLRWADSLLPDDSPDAKIRTLSCILLVLVLTAVTSNVCRFLGEVLVAGAVLRALMDLRDKLYEQTLHLPMAFFAGTKTSDVVTRFVQDIQEIQRGLLTLFGKAIREPIHAMFLLALALTIDWRITMTITVVVPIIIVVFWTVGRSVKKANRKLLQCYGEMIGALTTSLQSLRVVKAYTAEQQEQARLDVVDRKMFRQQLKLARLDAFLSPMMETVAIIAGSLLTVWLAGRVLDHHLSMSKFAALGATLSMLFDPLRKLTDVYVRIQRSTAGAERIFHVLNEPKERPLDDENVEIKPLRQCIEFVDVSFTYPASNAQALSSVSLTIEKGETVALVGPNGSGKTTLVNLLPRFFDPQQGKVCYDGIDIRRSRLRSLRRSIGIVSQESVVFGGTPIENIAYGDANPDRDRVIEAARRAYADEFLCALPGGYDSVLGERGTTLSGGQRQRIAIARAIYHNAPILIFDEATSQIDSESELKIQTAVREFAQGRTTIIVAHRLSTIQFAGRIVVMNAGRIIDAGTHRDLFDRCTLYRTLCETQLIGES
jgi:ABC-type multidrug transport system fused ATPase/permease subunit